ALLLDERADLRRIGEHHRRAVALHAGADDHGLAGTRAVLAGIGLEAQVVLPDLLRLAVGGAYRVGVAAASDRGHLPFGRRALEIDLAAAHHHSPLRLLRR